MINKYHSKRKIVILLLLSVLMLISLACQINIGGPQKPDQSIPISQESADSVVQSWEDAVNEGLVSGTFAVTYSEEQLSSLIAIKFAEQNFGMIQNPQVLLRNGSIDVYGEGVQGPISANIFINIIPFIDSSGNLAVEVAEIDFGPLPIPSDLVNDITNLVEDEVANSISYNDLSVKITSIQVADGYLTIEGSVY